MDPEKDLARKIQVTGKPAKGGLELGLGSNVLKLGLGLGIGNDSASLNLMTRITQKYIKY